MYGQFLYWIEASQPFDYNMQMKSLKVVFLIHKQNACSLVPAGGCFIVVGDFAQNVFKKQSRMLSAGKKNKIAYTMTIQFIDTWF